MNKPATTPAKPINQAKGLRRRDVVALLSFAGYFDSDELQRMVRHAEASDLSFWEILLQEKNLSEDKVADIFAQRLKISRVSVADAPLDHTVELIPEKKALEHLYLQMGIDGRKLTLCMANPADVEAIREVEFSTGFSVTPVVAPRSEVVAGIRRFYARAAGLDAIVKDAQEERTREVKQPVRPKNATVELDDLRSAQQAPVVQLVNLIVDRALRDAASDIHIEASETEVQVRLRVDGLLHDAMTVPKSLQAGIISRIKILADMDISEKRRPQDGRISVNFKQKRVDLRVSTLPNRDGEKVVMRVLGSGKAIPSLSQLGMEKSDYDLLHGAITRSQGMILVTGPTGSGKTTTLYSALSAKMTRELNVITIEDPIEFHLPGITQVQVSPKSGLTFASTLRSVLRQDPDVILVGEIRDEETAEIAFHAAMTGHLVLSSLHTNSALATIHRLLKLHIEPFLVGSSVNLVIAQRLVRAICPACKEECQPARRLLKRLGVTEKDGPFYHGKGCEACASSGYTGRTGLYEVLAFTPAVQEAIDQELSGEALVEVARSAGMRLLLEDALDKVKKGITTLEEVQRVASVGEQSTIPCPECGVALRSNFLSCPYCLAQVKRICVACKQELEDGWRLCPFCSHPAEIKNAVRIEDKGDEPELPKTVFQ